MARARSVTADCHRALVRATDEPGLLNAVCRILVDKGGYAMAWVGLVRRDEARSIERVAAAGGQCDDADTVRPSWGNNECGTGPAERAVRDRSVQIIRDVGTDRRFKRWRELAQSKGFASAAALPLICDDEPIGVLGIFAAEPQSFDADEVELLTGLSHDLAYGCRSLRLQQAQRQAEDRLRKLDRARRVMAQCNRALARTENEQALYQEICTILSGPGGYYATWIGAVLHDEQKAIQAVAHAGFPHGYFETAQISWASEGTRGRGPAGRAVRSGEPQLQSNIDLGQGIVTWHQSADSSSGSALVIPLKEGERVAAVLGVITGEKDAFDADEVSLLTQLAEDITYGRDNLRHRAAQREAEDKVAQNERRFHATFDLAPVGITHIAPEGEILLANARFEQIMGYGPGELLGHNIQEFLIPDDRELLHKVGNLRLQLYAGHIDRVMMETRYRRKDGVPVWVELTIALIRDAQGRPLYDLSTTVDISERKAAEAESRRSEERYRSLTELVSDRYWEQDEQYRFTTVIDHSSDVTLRETQQTLLGKRRWEMPFRNMSAADWDAHRALLDAREPFHDLDLQRLDEDGVPLWIRVSGHPVFDSRGRFTGYRGIARDITHRKRADQMRNLEHAVASALASVQDAHRAMNLVLRTLCEFDGWECARYFELDERPGVLRLANAWGIADPAIERFMAGSRELVFGPGVGVVGQAWQSGGPVGSRDIREDPRAVRKDLSSASDMRGVFAFPIISAGQCIGVVALSSRAHREADPLVLRAVGAIGSQVGQFVQRRRAEEALRMSEERFRSLTELVSDWYWEQDEHYRFTNVFSRVAAAPLPGMPPEQLLGRTHWELPYVNMTEADWAVHRAKLEARESFHELTLQRHDSSGASVWLRVSGHPLFDTNGRFTGYRGIARNITEIVRAEQLQKLEHAVAGALARTQDPEHAIPLVIQTIGELDGWDCGRYFELDEKSNLLRFAGSWSTGDAGIEAFVADSHSLTFAPGVGMAGRAWQSRAPIWSSKVRADPRVLHKRTAVAAGINSAFAFPVSSAGQCLGIVSLSSRRAREADERVLRAVSAIGSQLGQFVQRSRAERALRQSEERFRSLVELSSDWYWEQDSEFRLTSVTGWSLESSPMLGVRRWEVPNFHVEDWSAHRAVLEAHQPFRDFEYTYTSPQGERHYLSISGEPLFGDDGAFLGYRGTGRDITRQKRIEEELRRFRASMDMSGDMIMIVDRATMRFVDCNDHACRLLGYSRKELLGMGPADLMPETREQLEQNIDKNIATAAPITYRRGVYFCKDGSSLPFEATRCVLQSEGQWLLVVIARDISERITAEQERRQAEERIRIQAQQQRLIAEFGRQALGNADLVDVLNRAVHLIADALNAPYCHMLQLDPQERVLILKAAAGRPASWLGRQVRLREGSVVFHQLPRNEPLIIEDLASDPRFPDSMLRREGVRSGVQVPIHGPQGSFGLLGAFSDAQRRFTEEDVNFLGSVANILAVAIERKNAEDRLAYLAQFDSLTGLPNRHLFHDRLAQNLAQARRNNSMMAVLFIDLDRFKLVNDTLGHAVGDKLLKEAAIRLQHCVRSSDTVGRLGGDEFSAILSDVAEPADASVVAQKIIEAFGRPFLLDSHETYVSASIGITVYPDDGDAAGTLIMNADAAMYRAKEQGRDNFQFFTREMNERALARVHMEAQLRRAIERSEFTLHYQPRIDLASGSISGFEALLRWNHPERGLILPAEFIPVLEDTGLIVPVGEWVLNQACERLVAWQSLGLPVQPVAVNLSARQFQQKDLESSVRRIVRSTGADASFLHVEITESLLMNDPENAARILRGLRDSGVKLSVDDFGTGYSSLSYLKRFPLDALKIDRAFVRDIATDPEDAAIALAIINLAHTLDLRVVAEGVENEAQLEFLTSHGCDEMQGYYFSKPVEPRVCEAMLRKGVRLRRPGSQLALDPSRIV